MKEKDKENDGKVTTKGLSSSNPGNQARHASKKEHKGSKFLLLVRTNFPFAFTSTLKSNQENRKTESAKTQIKNMNAYRTKD